MKFFFWSIFWLIVSLVVVAFGCYKFKQHITANPQPIEDTNKSLTAYRMDDVRRIHDDEKKVTCWVLSGGYLGSNAGISCIADSEIHIISK